MAKEKMNKPDPETVKRYEVKPDGGRNHSIFAILKDGGTNIVFRGKYSTAAKKFDELNNVLASKREK